MKSLKFASLLLLISCTKIQVIPKMVKFSTGKYVFNSTGILQDTLEIDKFKTIFSKVNNRANKRDILYIKNAHFENNENKCFEFYFHEPMLTQDNKLASSINFSITDKNNNRIIFRGINRTNINLRDSNKLNPEEIFVINNEEITQIASTRIASIKWNYKRGILGYKFESDTFYCKVEFFDN